MKAKKKRFNFDFNEALYQQVAALAEEEGVPVSTIIHKLLKAGLIMHEASQSPDVKLIRRNGDDEHELVFV